MRPPRPHPLSSFGWSLLGALALTLSLPPVGFYPAAWVAFVPILVRWSARRPSWAYLREAYALFLTTACCAGFWLLFHPEPARALVGGAGLLLAPLPLALALVAAAAVRVRWGLAAGLAAFALNVLAAEFVLLHGPVKVPWLLLGHTQTGALPFIQTADLGGVVLLSGWVLALNAAAFLGLAFRAGTRATLLDRGLAAAVFAGLLVVPAGYGAVRVGQVHAPPGYLTLALVQPGMPSASWTTADGAVRVDHAAELADALAGPGAAPRPGSSFGAGAPRRPDLVVWPHATLPAEADAGRRERLQARLGAWSRHRGVALLAGTAEPGANGALAHAALFFPPDGAAAGRYEQAVHLPVLEAGARWSLGGPPPERALFAVGRSRVATAVGFEGLLGDPLRQAVQAGADLVVVLAQTDLWGRLGAAEHHAGVVRLRAIETRRSVVLSTVSGGSALFHADGRTQEAAGWMQQAVTLLDVPAQTGQTFYVRHGDWPGRFAAWAAFALYVALFAAHWLGLGQRLRPPPLPDPFAPGRKPRVA